MSHQNYLYLEYRRTLSKFRKLQNRFEKRLANNTFQELTARKRHKLLTQLRKLKQKIVQLTSRLKLATAGGSLALSLGLMIGAQTEGLASTGPTGIGVPKTLTTDKTLLNTETDGSQENPDVAINDLGESTFVWESASNQIMGKGFGSDGESIEFTVTDDTFRNVDPSVALNDEGDFVVAWSSYELTSPYSTYSIKYMRYEVDGDEIVPDGPYTIAQGTSTESKALNNPDVAISEDGNFVIVWGDSETDVSDIKARYVNTENVSDLELNVTDNSPTESAKEPAVDIDDEGNFTVIWQESFDMMSASTSSVKSRKYRASTALESEKVLVSESGITDRLRTPDIALSGDGSFAIAWHDDYTSLSQEYIYAKSFDSEGTELCQITVVDDVAFQNLSDPAVAADKDGGFAVVYALENISSELSKISGARFNQLGGRHEDLDFYTGGEEEGENPSIAMNSRGDFVVAWDDREGEVNACEENLDCEGTGVYFKQYKDAGNAPYCLVEEAVVNDFSTGTQYRPSIDVDQNGNYVVVWQGEWHSTVEDGSGIIGQRYNADGTKEGSEFQINTTTTNNQLQPSVAMDPSGNFVVAWSSYDGDYSGDYNIRAQKFIANGSKDGSELLVDQVDGAYEVLFNPSVDMNSDGDAIIVWQRNNSSYGNYGLYARRLESDGQFAGDEFKVDSRTTAGSRNNPDVALDNDGGFVVAWGARIVTDEQTFIRRFDNKDNALDQNDVQISTGSSAQQRTQSIDMDKVSGDFLVAFTKEFGSYSSILASKYKSDGTAIFEEELLTNAGRADDEPHVSGNDNGEFAVVWNNSSGNNHAAISMFNEDNELEYEKFMAIDPDNSMVGVSVALDGDGDAMVVTGAYYSGGYNIYSKKLGRPLSGNIDAGSEFIVNSKIAFDQKDPDVAQNTDGDFVVVWYDFDANPNSEYTIRAQRYDEKGVRQGDEITVNNGTNNAVGDPAVALKDDGNFMVVWREYSAVGGEDDDVLGSLFDWDGNVVKDDFIINEETSHHQRNPDIAINHKGNFQVIWTERRSITTPWNKLYAREVSSDGTPDALGEQFLYDVGESANVSLQASVAVNDDGNMAIPYIYSYDGVKSGFFVFDEDAQVLVDDVDFSTSEQVDSRPPSISTNQDGDFVVAWSEYDLGNSKYDQMVRKYTSGSDFDADAVKVNDFTKHSAPSIIAVDDGDFIISSADRDDSDDFYNIYVQRLSSSLETIGPAILANNIDGSDVNENAIAASPDGSYTVVWQSSYADGSDEAIMARQFVSHKPVIENQGLTLDEGSEADITATELSFSNPSDNNNSAILTVNQLPSQGTLKLDGNNVALFQELDEDDMFFLSYEHDGSETTSDLFTFSVANADFETNNYTFSITVNPVNDEPDLTAN
ncbi:MAG: cadherin-like domain-containing protein, partial [Reichenbachiella sp.]|uniref:cadherin-like domain-containing protein n=1 Tax=Reichenbachiella sp. TaxID=2184521 RepID=UPI0032657A06